MSLISNEIIKILELATGDYEYNLEEDYLKVKDNYSDSYYESRKRIEETELLEYDFKSPKELTQLLEAVWIDEASRKYIIPIVVSAFKLKDEKIVEELPDKIYNF